jgi:hypothetical protein
MIKSKKRVKEIHLQKEFTSENQNIICGKPGMIIEI